MALLARMGIRCEDVLPSAAPRTRQACGQDWACRPPFGRLEQENTYHGHQGRHTALVVSRRLHRLLLLWRMPVSDSPWAQDLLTQDRYAADVGLGAMCSERVSAVRAQHIGRRVETAPRDCAVHAASRGFDLVSAPLPA